MTNITYDTLFGPLRYAVMFGHDGVFETMIGQGETLGHTKKLVKSLIRQGIMLENMAILDASVGRFVSFVL